MQLQFKILYWAGRHGNAESTESVTKSILVADIQTSHQAKFAIYSNHD